MTELHDVTTRSLSRRDRIAILSGLAGVTALSWAYLISMAFDMQSMADGSMAQIRTWELLDFAMMFAMWAVMMVGMMVPTAAPATLIYAAVGRKAAREGTPLAPTTVFVAGYVMMWTVFSVGATLAQWGLDQAALLSPMMVANSPWLGAALLVAAGAYQLTPYKDACLRRCRSPVHFIAEHWRSGKAGAFRLGALYGAYCLGCCWILMGLLFFGGVMSLLWIAGITLFVLLEKVMPGGARAGRIAGIGMLASGLALLVGWI